MPDRIERRGPERKRTDEEERASKGKAIEAPTGVLNTITKISSTDARKRKIREIAVVASIAPHNRVKRADGSDIRIPHGDPLVITLRI